MAVRRQQDDQGASTPRRQQVLDYLAERGGRITSADGRGITADMASTLGYGDITALNAMLSRLQRDGSIKRDIKGRRTYAISLTARGQKGSGTTAASAGARSRRSPGRPVVTPRSSGTRTRRASSASTGGVAELASLLSRELESLHRSNQELTRRVEALESNRASASRNGSRRR